MSLIFWSSFLGGAFMLAPKFELEFVLLTLLLFEPPATKSKSIKFVFLGLVSFIDVIRVVYLDHYHQFEKNFSGH